MYIRPEIARLLAQTKIDDAQARRPSTLEFRAASETRGPRAAFLRRRVRRQESHRLHPSAALARVAVSAPRQRDEAR
jgi:hypothetical protein